MRRADFRSIVATKAARLPGSPLSLRRFVTTNQLLGPLPVDGRGQDRKFTNRVIKRLVAQPPAGAAAAWSRWHSARPTPSRTCRPCSTMALPVRVRLAQRGQPRRRPPAARRRSRPTPTRTPWCAWTSSTRSASPSFPGRPPVAPERPRRGAGSGTAARPGSRARAGAWPGSGWSGSRPVPPGRPRPPRVPSSRSDRPTPSCTPAINPFIRRDFVTSPQDPTLAGEERPVVRLLVDREAVQERGGELGPSCGPTTRGWSRSWCRCCGAGWCSWPTWCGRRRCRAGWTSWPSRA